MIVGDKYRADRVDGAFDIVVVGSGMGGLATAALLAREGRRVLVLERHFTAGGFTHSFTRKGFEWDVGVHYVGELCAQRSPLARLFRAVTDGAVRWAPMDQLYDEIHVADRVYHIPIGYERFRETLLGHFPREGAAIDRYLALVWRVNATRPLTFFPKAFPRFLQKTVSGARTRVLSSYFRPTTGEVLASLTDNAELRAVLCGQWGDYGLPPGQSSFGIHAMIAGHYLRKGALYPLGGGSSIAAAAKKVIERSGGRVMVRAEVSEIVVHKEKVAGVRLSDGNEINAPIVVSAAGLDTTVTKLLRHRPEGLQPARATSLAIGQSVGHLCLYVGLQDTSHDLQLSSRNVWVHPTADFDRNYSRYLADEQSPFPYLFISFPSAKDPTWQSRRPHRATAEVSTIGVYDRFARWRDTPWRKRGADYQAYKEEITERLLNQLLGHAPRLREKIVHRELSTPLSTEHFTNYANGAMYGLAHSPARYVDHDIGPRTGVSGLYLAGQDVGSVGVVGALISGLIAASAVSGLRVFRNVVAG